MNPPDQLPLRDIHLPPAPAWWPPAPGWWALLTLIMCAALAAWWWRRRRRRRRSAIVEARTVLAGLRAGAQDAEPRQLAAELSALLRRVCVSLWPREQVAGLTGDGWLRFLDQVRGGDDFARGAGHLLTRAPYRPGVTHAELEALMDLCTGWLDAMEQRSRKSAP